MTHSDSHQRLQGSHVILTGAAGNIGSVISRHLLREGARLVLTGRNLNKLQGFVETLVSEGFAQDHMAVVAGDCADAQACRDIVAQAVGTFGPIDVLINNAGGAGPKRTLREIPFAEAEKSSLGEAETMYESALNLLGGPWNMVRAAVAQMSAGGSIINVSTIFSRTGYYGRIPYAVPKSGLNALSQGLAQELGGEGRAIRVNTIFPGPIKSERIDTVFAAMDQLQDLEPGSTSAQFRGLMLLQRAEGDFPPDFRYPTPTDVAGAAVFLSSDESAALSGHAIEVTNGMQVPAQSRSKLVSWPDERLVDLRDRVILVLGGEDVEEALVFAEHNQRRGAQVVLAFRNLDAAGAARARAQGRLKGTAHVQLLDPLRPETMQRSLQFVRDHFGRLDGVVFLPALRNGEHGYSLAQAEDEDVAHFIRREVVAPVAFAAALAKHLQSWDPQPPPPPVTFVTNGDDGRGNRLNEIRRAAVEELIRIWRDEEEHRVSKGEWGWSALPNQLVRYANAEDDNLAFSADWTATLNNGARKMDAINLWVPKSIQRATGKSAMPQPIQRVLPGLHHGKTALITGGSLGIGMQLGRYLAMAGARVLLAARSAEKLEAAREEIIAELRGVGYARPEQRVFVLDNIDVSREADLQRLYDHTLAVFGELDYLINNAGISGAEEMVVDMSLEAWDMTMEANLVSNYSLIRKFAPRMKERGRGVVLNVSSYFGGEKYVAVAYPNRADYTVSKAGQRALAEILSRHLGPEIQINAMAPGPVDGARLRGLGGKPGLFERRGRLVKENQRLNQVHGALVAALNAGASANDILQTLACNDIAQLQRWEDAPAAMQKLFAKVAQGDPASGASHSLLSAALVPKLLNRLRAVALISAADAQAFESAFVPPSGDFFSASEVQRAAEKIEAGILDRLHLHKMPTDEQVGLSTVFSLADDSVSGETFHPSGGLKFDRSVTEGELMLKPGAADLERLQGKHVLLIGDAMREEIVAIAEGFLRHRVARISMLTRTEEVAEYLRHRVEGPGGALFEVRASSADVEEDIRQLIERHGPPDVVVNTPCVRLPLNALASEAGGDWSRVLSRDEFAGVVRDQLTHHFRVARVAALLPRCQVVLLTPDTSRASTREEFALALFIKTALHAFTVTLGVEGERLPTAPAVNQVQLTRRARAEEPSTDQELAEEMERVVDAVLACSVPAPTPSQSRYLSRIFRGNAVTV